MEFQGGTRQEAILCQCSQCIRVPGAAQTSSFGQYIPRSTYFRHQQSEAIAKKLGGSGLDELGQAVSLMAICPDLPSQHKDVEIGPLPFGAQPVHPHNPPPIPHDHGAAASTSDLEFLQCRLNQLVLSTPLRGPLSFHNSPPEFGPFQPDVERQILGNSGLHALTICFQNRTFLDYHNSLEQLLVDIESVESAGIPAVRAFRKNLVERVQNELQRLLLFKQAEWERQQLKGSLSVIPGIGSMGGIWIDTGRHFNLPHHRWNPIVLSAHLIVVLFHLLCRLPQDATRLLLAGIRTVISVSFVYAGLPTLHNNSILNQIPKDPRTAINSFDIDPRMHSYICCTACYALYPDSPSDSQVLCPNILRNSNVCGAKLMRSRRIRGRQTFIPVRKYLHQDMKEWMGRLLSRNGLEDKMDATPFLRMADGRMADIWDAKVFREFKGYDQKPFVDPSLKEGRYVFGLNIDSFNPFFNREAKQSTSVTGIYLVCLSLPPDMRYLPENMYLVGIIPGPGKPSKSQFNNFTKLIVDQLNEFWHPGVFFTQTAKCPNGRLVRCALIPLICDAVGARPIAGFRSITSRWFCTYCKLDMKDIENIDPTTWPPRDVREHKADAEAWKNAVSPTDQAIVEERSGVFWSELLRLVYWNPVLFTVVDVMHNLFLGLLEDHCREIWGMDVKSEGGDGLKSPAGSKYALPSAVKMDQARNRLFDGDLKDTHKSVLWHLCESLELRRGGGRSQLVKTLMEWRGQPAGQAWLNSFVPVRNQDSLEMDPESIDMDVASKAEDGESYLRTKPSCNLASRLNKPVLQILCRRRGLLESGTKADLALRLQQWQSSQPALVTSLRDEAPRRPGKKVLGREILTALHEDMQNTEVPSWINPAPLQFGLKSRGKLSADQWHSVCAINLPVTLIQLWGHDNGRKKEMLHNFLTLIVAVNLATARIITQDHINQYSSSMMAYLSGLKKLYPEASIKPNHHMSLHLPDFMTNFGPVHPIQTFGFERLNYNGQLTNTDLKFGEMEMTIAMTASRAANFRPLMSDPHVRHHLGDLLKAFEDFINQDERGTRIRNALSLIPEDQMVGRPKGGRRMGSELSLDIYEALCLQLNKEADDFSYASCHRTKLDNRAFLNAQAILCQDVKVGGVRYQANRISPRNSNACYNLPGLASPVFGRIVEIFLHSRRLRDKEMEETFIAVQQLAELSHFHSQGDPFRQFSPLFGNLHYAQYSESIRIIRPQDLVCHFAKTSMQPPQIGRACFHALPLDRLQQRIPNLQDFDDELVDRFDGLTL